MQDPRSIQCADTQDLAKHPKKSGVHLPCTDHRLIHCVQIHKS